MIDTIEIKNFKSIVDLTINLGRFNVIIGANGCGKTNILEAITFASAASQNKLDTASLMNRDIRVPDFQYMFNAFEDQDETEDAKVIQFKVISKPKLTTLIYVIYAEKIKEWVNLYKSLETIQIQKALELYENKTGNRIDLLHKNEDFSKIEETEPEMFQLLKDNLLEKPELSSFVTYRPSEPYLRRSYETALYPFGIKGEGLLKYLKDLDKDRDENAVKLIQEINKGLHLLEWFDGFSIPEDLLSNEYKLSIGDKYLKESIKYFDQRSTNEGFLYLLFYLTLFNSNDTPSFFAIDNVETSFNPKLCTKLIEYLLGASKNNKKQVILTTHNPYVLDGLDLSNDEIRLFVARRDIDGHTRLERVNYREDRNMLLSDLWMSGLIGGLPDNF